MLRHTTIDDGRCRSHPSSIMFSACQCWANLLRSFPVANASCGLNLQGPVHFGPAELASHRMRRTAPMYLGKAFGALHRTIQIQNIQKPSRSQEMPRASGVRFWAFSLFELGNCKLLSGPAWHQLLRYFKAMRCAATRLVPWSSAKPALRTKVRKPSH